MPAHRNGCRKELMPVTCGATHIHRCDCGRSVCFRLMLHGCELCDAILTGQPTFGDSRDAGNCWVGDDELENARDVLDSLVA
jgi:hypothetical protein